MGTIKVDRGTYRFVVSAILVMSVFSPAALGQGRQWMRVGDRLLAFDGTGWVVQNSGFAAGSWGIAVDGFGRTWSTNYVLGQNTITCADSAGLIVGTYPAGLAAPTNDSTVGPVAISRDNLVFVGDPTNSGNTITVLDPNGTMFNQFTVPAFSIRSLCFDPEGNLWVHCYYATGPQSSLVFKYDIVGTLLLSAPVPPTGIPNHVYADEWGRVFVTHHPTSTHVRQLRLDGSVVADWNLNFSGGTQRTIHAGLDGRLMVCHSGYRRLVNPLGATLSGSLSFGLPTSVTVDSGGNYQVFQYSSTSRLTVIRPDGSIASENVCPAGPLATTYCFNIGDFSGMHRIRVVDPDGDFDQDQVSNREELARGSDPRDAQSVPSRAEFTWVAPPQIGTQMAVRIQSWRDSNTPYLMPFTLNSAAFPMSGLATADYRTLPVNPLSLGSALEFDPIFLMSMDIAWPGALIFPDTAGAFDAMGEATVRVNIPVAPGLSGFTIYACFVTVVPGLPASVRSISSALPVTFY